MEQNQCPCGLLSNSREDLNTHIAGHKPSNWNCCQYSKVYDSRGVLYKHYREKHIGVFQYNCIKSVSMAMMKEHKWHTTCFISMVLK